MDQIPSIGRVVHYVSYGTPGGEYTSQCRAAIITEVDLELEIIGLCVLSPTGVFFHDSTQDEVDHRGGTWHWPERVDHA